MNCKSLLSKQLLRYAAGSVINCPECGQIMDWRRTVTTEFHATTGNTTTYTACTRCWDSCAPRLLEVAARNDIEVETIDARDILSAEKQLSLSI